MYILSYNYLAKRKVMYIRPHIFRLFTRSGTHGDNIAIVAQQFLEPVPRIEVVQQKMYLELEVRGHN